MGALFRSSASRIIVLFILMEGRDIKRTTAVYISSTIIERFRSSMRQFPASFQARDYSHAPAIDFLSGVDRLSELLQDNVFKLRVDDYNKYYVVNVDLHTPEIQIIDTFCDSGPDRLKSYKSDILVLLRARASKTIPRHRPQIMYPKMRTLHSPKLGLDKAIRIAV